MAFHPWRKGPFAAFGVEIDTEWRSDLKWDRLSEAIDFGGKSVLDVGCGNGYYGWRMLDEGAKFVLGCEPFTLYSMQFEVFRRYASQPEAHFVIPAGDTDLPAGLRAFDLAFSMGVLYHRPSPIDHLQRMRSTLGRDGQLVLETIVLDAGGNNVLTPESRYAKMRNVWFLPSVELLCIWLRRSGFRDIEVIDVSRTTIKEQRRTSWMTFESLADFLDPNDHTKTIEGYPAPTRAILTARCK
jgi:tRNA (mo5U34)-methyltransferase